MPRIIYARAGGARCLQFAGRCTARSLPFAMHEHHHGQRCVCSAEVRVLLDTAHTRQSARSVLAAVRDFCPSDWRRVLLIGMANDKDASGVVEALSAVEWGRVMCVEAPIGGSHHRTMAAGELVRHFRNARPSGSMTAGGASAVDVSVGLSPANGCGGSGAAAVSDRLEVQRGGVCPVAEACEAMCDRYCGGIEATAPGLGIVVTGSTYVVAQALRWIREQQAKDEPD